MSIAFPLAAGAAGLAAGWMVSKAVDKFTLERTLSTHQVQTTGNKNIASLLATIGSGLLIAALALKFKTAEFRFFTYSGLALLLVGVTVFDIRKHVIPHVVTVPGTVIGLICGSQALPLGLKESVLGLVIGAAVLLAATIVEAIRKKEIGGGDWKYAAMIGSFIGPQRIIVALVLSGILGLFGAIILKMAGKHSEPQALGPWLSAGAVASMLLLG